MHKPLTTGQPLLMYLGLWSLTITMCIPLQINAVKSRAVDRSTMYSIFLQFPNSKKTSFRGNYMRKYDIVKLHNSKYINRGCPVVSGLCILFSPPAGHVKSNGRSEENSFTPIFGHNVPARLAAP